MADFSVTKTQVAPDTTRPVRTGVAAVAITPGQAVCYDPSTNTVKLYDANDSAVYSLQPGIAVSEAAAAGQPVTWQETAGAEVTIGAGASIGVGIPVFASATAGGLAPFADLATGHVVVLMGVGMTGNKIKLAAWNSGIVKA